MANQQNLKPWKPGNSGNPSGKPRGTKHLSTWIQELLNDEEFTTSIRLGLDIVEYKGAPIKAILGAQIHKAVHGDAKAFDLLAKYGYGNKLDITSAGQQVIPILPIHSDDFTVKPKN